MNTLERTPTLAKRDVRSRLSPRPRPATPRHPRRKTESSFESLALPHLSAVYNFAWGLTRNREVAEDVAQDTFLNAFRSFHTFEPRSNVKAWLFKICRNVVYDGFRRLGRRPTNVPIEDREPASFDPSLASRTLEAYGVDDEATHAVLFGDDVNRFLEELPPEFRRALLLCDVEGLSYKETAGVMGTPLGTVRSRIARARSHLRDRLESRAVAMTP